MPVLHGARESAFDVAEQGGHGGVAPQRGAVHLDKGPADLMPGLLQLEDPPGEARLARAGRAHQQHRGAGANGHPLQVLDEPVEIRVPSGDARFQEGKALLHFPAKARGDLVVARQVQVDDRPLPHRGGPARRGGLHQLRREVARLGQQEEADLRYVRAGGDMHQVFLPLRLEGVAARELVQRAIHFLEIPGILKLDRRQAHLRFRGDRPHVLRQRPGEARPTLGDATTRTGPPGSPRAGTRDNVGRHRSHRLGPFPASSTVPRSPMITRFLSDIDVGLGS